MPMNDEVQIDISFTHSDSHTVTNVTLPKGCPLYVPIPEAARIAGVSQETMRAWVERTVDPIPTITVGNAQNKTSKKLVSASAIPRFCCSLEN